MEMRWGYFWERRGRFEAFDRTETHYSQNAEFMPFVIQLSFSHIVFSPHPSGFPRITKTFIVIALT